MLPGVYLIDWGNEGMEIGVLRTQYGIDAIETEDFIYIDWTKLGGISDLKNWIYIGEFE